MAIVRYVSRLDLGQVADHTALAVLEQTLTAEKPGRKTWRFAVRHLQRFQLGTPYTTICTQVAETFASRPLTGTELGVDQTGVGRPVVDMLRRSKLRARIHPVTITGGNKAAVAPEGGWLVPKKESGSTLQVLLQSRRIKVAPSLPDSQILVKELLNFQVKITASANETFGTWREGAHDDLLLAIAIGAWIGERVSVPTCLPRVISQGVSVPRPW